MRTLFSLAQEVQTLLEAEEMRFCFIGGLALQRWGENRLTRDIDLSVFTDFGGEREVISRLLAHFRGRLEDTADFAIKYRVLLLQSEDGTGIDVALAALPFESDMIARASNFHFFPDCLLKTCGAEDLVVLKAFASRPQDWVDIRGILVRQGPMLDRAAVLERLTPLVILKEEPEILIRLEGLFSEVPA